MSGNDPVVGETEQPGRPKAAERPAQPDGGPTGEPQAAGEGDGQEGMPSEVDRLASQRDEYLDMLQRLQAEFENYRKRTMRQQTDLLQRASAGVVERLLPVLDAFDLALAHVGEKEESSNGDLKAALSQIDSLLRKSLETEGLERIDEVGVAFDPSIHHAVAHEPAPPAVQEEGEEPTQHPGARVSEVMRAGYRLQGRVIRPALVKVEG